MKWLAKHKSNIHSQGGQDGYIGFLLDALNIKSGWCMEAGAWDGVFLSNTCALVERGFNSVMIESDPIRFRSLEKNYKTIGAGKIVPLHMALTPETAEEAVKPIPEGQEAVLSLDMDGNERAVWMALWEHVRFPIVCIEWADAGKRHPWGVMRQAEQFGYRYIAATNSDIILLHSSRFDDLCEAMEPYDE